VNAKTLPIELPFGIKLAACHGIPIAVVGAIVAAVAFFIVATTSRLVPPVTLNTIWLVPDKPLTVSQVANGTVSLKMGKAGQWTRLCPSYAIETVSDAHDTFSLTSGKHNIDVPYVVGPIEHAPRPIAIPPILNHPGHYVLRLDVYSECFAWERFWPIASTTAETTFQIVPDSM
jgi:hypothetical protein